ncbi:MULTISPECIES: TetR/AcrR family transcriptional regulator [Nonomuraea]|uniref:TetR/AcrR family transcriptional regulator n=1 Tax=Nonomuraea ferruginea TaxID=46174 RepID=A0ABT4TCE4_9ACTN|nr:MULTISPECIES: TetR/AcrR family transcriptional regulator [Nonomuraea]MDA0647025.1 TetR/AcrR family transcriptional regulator [Nonomuraea ferruginea]
MTGGGRPRGRPRDPGADDLIMKAALELFAERGLEGANFEQIAKRAGVAKVTVYRRWSSKEELLVQAIERARTVAPEEEIWAGADVPEQDGRLMDSWATTFGDARFRAVLAQLIGSSVTHPSLLETYRETYIEPRRRLVLETLERARRDGRLAAGADVEAAVDMVVGAAMYRMLVGPRDDDTRRYLERVIRQAGLAPGDQ